MKIVDDDTLTSLSEEGIYLDLKSWITRFLEDKTMRKLSDKSIKSYDDALKNFLSFAKLYEDDNTIENIGAKFVNRYLIHYQATLAKDKLLKSKNIDNIEKYQKVINQENEKFLGRNSMMFEVLEEFENTLLHRSNVVKMLLKYISENNSDGHDYQSSFHDIKTIKISDKDTGFLTIDELDQVIDFMSVWINIYKQYKPKSSLRYAYRDSLMILIYALTGARSAEVVKIKLEDVTPFTYYKKDYYKIRIEHGKGGHKREIGIGADFIKEHIEFFKKELPSDDYYLSSSYKKGSYTVKSMHPDNIRKFGNYILSILNIKKTGLHTFRRAYATKRVVYDKKDVSIVSKELGNTSAVLEKYYLKYNSEMSVVK